MQVSTIAETHTTEIQQAILLLNPIVVDLAVQCPLAYTQKLCSHLAAVMALLQGLSRP